MSRTRERAKGRRGGEAECFARIPDDAMRSAALMTANHASFRVLAILLLGKPKERNGTMMCSNSYAEKFGITSRETLARALSELSERGLIVKTRQGMRMRKIPNLWAVTWWPIYNRDGMPLDKEEPATFAYRNWKPNTPISHTRTEFHTDNRADVTPTNGADH